MIALLSSMFGVLVGLVMGAAIQRWGDADRATHGHTVYPPRGDVWRWLNPGGYWHHD